MRLSKLSEFRRLMYTPDSAPTLPTLRARINKGTVPGGVVVGGRYYVDLDEFDRVTDYRRRLQAEIAELEKSPLLEGLV